MPSPRMARTAGRNVSDPTTEMNTTEIVPTAIERKSGSSSRNRPAIEIMTARPEKKTARPAVLEAVWIALSLPVSSPRSMRREIDQITMPPITAADDDADRGSVDDDRDDERADRGEDQDHPPEIVVPSWVAGAVPGGGVARSGTA